MFVANIEKKMFTWRWKDVRSDAELADLASRRLARSLPDSGGDRDAVAGRRHGCACIITVDHTAIMQTSLTKNFRRIK